MLRTKYLIVLVAVMSLGLLAGAQGPGPMGQFRFIGPVGPGMQGGFGGRGWEAFLGGPGRGPAVTGAPFSATAVSQSAHPLTDGDTTQHSRTTAVARDAEGRTWAQTTEPAGRGGAANAATQTVVYINDPVARISYELFPAKQQYIEHKYPPARGRGGRGPGAGGPGGHGPDATPPSRPGTTVTTTPTMLDGLSVNETTVTTVIPAGQEGNASPITITRADWYSEQLHLVLQANSNDPRNGTSSFALQNLQLNAPDATLFSVPSGYTLAPGRGGRGGRGR